MEGTANKTMKSPFKIVQFGEESCKSNHSYGPAIRNHWLLHFVRSGKGHFDNRRASYELSGGSMFIIRPGEVTYYEADSDDPWHYEWIGFEMSCPVPDVLDRDIVSSPCLAEIFTSVKKAFTLSSASALSYLSGQLICLVALLSDEEEKKLTVLPDYPKMAINIMESEYSTPLSVSGIAKRLHLSRVYFTNVFTDSVGLSPGRYLLNLRMDKAMHLLRSTELTVSVIAASVGFSDVFSFSRSFKNRYGISPTEARSVTEY